MQRPSANQITTEIFGSRRERSIHDVAVPEARLTEFHRTANHRPLRSFVWDRKANQ